MSDKYPNLSPYTYCADNPVRLVDEDGREVCYGGDPLKSHAKFEQFFYKKSQYHWKTKLNQVLI